MRTEGPQVGPSLLRLHPQQECVVNIAERLDSGASQNPAARAGWNLSPDQVRLTESPEIARNCGILS